MTVIGMILLILNGSVVGSTGVHPYSSTAECEKAAHEALQKAGPPPEGQLAILCIDLAENINGQGHQKPPSTSL